MDEVFVAQTNFASLRACRKRLSSLQANIEEVARAPRVTEGVAAQKAKMFYGKSIETALHALSLTLVPRELPRGGSL